MEDRLSGFTLRHWSAPGGHPEFVYVESPAFGKISGQHCAGDRISWRSKEMPQSAVDAIVAQNFSHLTGWRDLLDLANSQPTQFVRGGRGRGVPAPTRSRNPTWTPQAQAGRDRPYGPGDTGTLDPAAMAHPIPEPTILLVDHREPEGIAQALSLVPNLIVEVTTLDVGDYMVPDRFVIERKTTHDFHTSVSEDAKRMFTQTMNMANLHMASLILIEGGACAQQRMTLNSIRGTQTYLSLIQNIPIIETIDQTDTVYTIAKAVRHVCYGLGYDLGLRAMSPKKAAATDPLASAAYVLEGVSGVSAASARALLAAFGSVQGVANAQAADLRKVPGIGPETARKISEALGGPDHTS